MKLMMVAVTGLLAGCSALGGIPPDTVGAIANAGGGCVKAQGLWGSGIIIVAGADKGVIRNGNVTVSGDCQGISITETKPAPVVPAVAPVVAKPLQ